MVSGLTNIRATGFARQLFVKLKARWPFPLPGGQGEGERQ